MIDRDKLNKNIDDFDLEICTDLHTLMRKKWTCVILIQNLILKSKK